MTLLTRIHGFIMYKPVAITMWSKIQIKQFQINQCVKCTPTTKDMEVRGKSFTRAF